VEKANPKVILVGNSCPAFGKRRLENFHGWRDSRGTVMKKLALLALPAAFALALTTTTAFAADGKAVYSDNCAKCHGDDGKGATKMGTKLGAKDYTDAAVQSAITDDQAFKSIKEGLKKDDKTLMKPSELSDEDIKASVTYLRTFKK
jgi:mono/diheme cytochrome c family protein